MSEGAIFLLVVFVVVGFVVAQQRKRPALPFEVQEITAKVRYVVDGDSLYLKGYKTQIRLWGVDAPEANQRGFNAAKEQLKRFALGQYVTCRIMDIDDYGRTVARCFLSNGQEINAGMIASGTAKEYKYFTKGFYSR